MTAITIYPREKTIYPNFYARLIVCLIIAHFIVSFGEKPNFFELLRLRYYYPALAGSFIITIVLSEFIYLMHYHFDQYYSWRKEIKVRIIIQVICCFVFSGFFAVVLAMVYFKLNHMSISTAGYFKYDFTVVLCFIAMVNLFYVIISLFELKLLPIRNNFSNVRICVEEQAKRETPAVIFSEEKHCYALQFDGSKFNWSKSLKETMAELSRENYFRINRSIILHHDIISHYRPAESDRLRLFLKAPFVEVEYYVSQRNTVDFKRWFEGDI